MTSSPLPNHEMTSDGLHALESQVQRDLKVIGHPKLKWLRAQTHTSGAPIRDVLIVGAGQSGIATAYALKRDNVDNVSVIDKASCGHEGPWITYARMRTLRSPKDYPGPDLGVPSLTYQSWHEAKYGNAAWRDLDLIPTSHWNDYLLWFRRIVGINVRNETTLTAIHPDDGCLRAEVETADGDTSAIYARKIVLATGQDGTGRWWMPDCINALPKHLRAHTADNINFAALAGKTIGVLGAGASAFDNAAEALDADANSVHLFCRRAALQTVQPLRYVTFHGFLRHLGDMEDAWRWRFMQKILGLREGFPQDAYDRCNAKQNFRIRTGEPWLDARVEGERAVVRTPRGEFAANFLICGTGVDMDCALRPELAPFANRIATWSDRYRPPPEEQEERLGRYPYLNADYSFQEKTPGSAPFLKDIHCFGIGAWMSFGMSGASINAMYVAVPKLAAGVTRGLFAAELDHHWTGLQAYDTSQVEMQEA
ncbi:MAG: FAD-dependent urate hydroxylase [Alphaproteobacteria bacterium MarineAlpha4_Bin2]|nr:MAG: FAD-dependent urate hydroxylase [Alphaproteobacteria bacterium MarineAlpha4_Bin2]